jgi:hypothetical protein
MTTLYAFVLEPLVLALTVATAWGQTSGGPETVVVHSGSATLHAMLWRPQGRGPLPAILLNHGSGRTRQDLEGLGADRVNLPRVLSPHEEATVRCAKARPGSNSSTGSQAPVRSKTSGPHASEQHTANGSRFH